MEYWDIYDSEKRPTGRTMKKNDWNMKDGEYHLTVQGVLRRPDGKYLITQRVATKAWAPLWWEVSGGGARAGETSRQAVDREVREETGIDVSGIKEDFIYTYRRDNPEEKDNYFVDTYLFTLDFDEKDVKVQEEEVAAFKLASLEEIKEIAAKGIFMHYDSIKTVFEH
jgi:8-oxo-dGTP diphosphatase